MQIIFFTLIFSLLFRQVIRFADYNTLRALSQGFAFLAAINIFIIQQKELSLQKYLPLFCFIIWLSISALFSNSIIYAGLQTVSLGAVVLFFIAFNEVDPSKEKSQKIINVYFVRTCILLLGISLILMKIAPDFAYFYSEIDGVSRLRGLFTNPEGLAGTAGLIWGLLIFSNKPNTSLGSKLFLSMIIIPALILSGCRTYWIACFASTSLLLFWIKPFINFKWNVISFFPYIFFCLGAASMLLVFDIGNFAPLIEKHIRLESIDNLSGRTYVWGLALERFQERPIIGHGLGSGDDAFKDNSSIKLQMLDRDTFQREARSTLHNGFIQALLDGGLVGFILYCIILAKAFYNILRCRRREYAAPLYAITFFIVVNMGQSSIMGAATYLGIMVWYYIVFGLSINDNI